MGAKAEVEDRRGNGRVDGGKGFCYDMARCYYGGYHVGGDSEIYIFKNKTNSIMFEVHYLLLL